MAELPIDLGALIKLAQRSQDLLYDDEENNAYADPRQLLRVHSAELAIVAVARTAAQVGAIGLLPNVRQWAEFSPTGEDPVSIPHALIDALAVCVREGLDVEQLEPMLADFEDWMVAKIAEALDPERESSFALLQRLAEDPRAKISSAASKRLGARREWRWWAGIFDHDPIEAHADDPEPGAAPNSTTVDAIRAARAALGRERAAADPGKAAELCAAVEGLPPALAIPLLEAGVRHFPFVGWHASPDPRLVADLHARGGVDALARALQRMLPSQGDTEAALRRIAPWFAMLPESVRVELALQLLGWMDDTDEPTRRGLARFVQHTWPRAVSPVPLLEWLVEHRHDRLVIASIFLRVPLQECTAELEQDAERLLELAQARPVLLHELSELYTTLGATVPQPQLMRLVETAAAASDERVRIWALEQRTARLAPTNASEREALAQAWLDDPKLRPLIAKSDLCTARLLPWMRRRLRAGALTLLEANQTIRTIGKLYGGVNMARPVLDRPSELEAAEQRKQNRAALGVWIDQPSGPTTAEEWACLRALTRHELATSPRPHGILWVRPIGPWRAEDLALLDELEHTPLPSGTDGVLLLMQVEGLLASKDLPDASARAGRLVAAWQDHATLGKHPSMAHLRELAAKTSSEQTAAPAAAAPRVSAPDWMDDDEEEHEP